MRKRPILSTARDLLGLRMNRYHATARKRPDVGLSFFVQCQIPSRNRLAPVANRMGERLPPIGPIGRVIGSGIVRTPFSPVHLSLRMRLVHLAHHLWRAHVSMKRNRVAVFS